MSSRNYIQDVSDFNIVRSEQHDKLVTAFKNFKSDMSASKHPILEDIFKSETLETINNYVQSLQYSVKTLVILGTGGSSLGARAIVQWVGFHNNPLYNAVDFNFVTTDNLDDLSFQILLQKIDIETTHFLVISKSGNTLETTLQAKILLRHFEDVEQKEKISTHITVITELNIDKKNNLHFLADSHNIKALPHSKVIGGRYSVLTMTGLLPTAILGIDIENILIGAQDVINELNNAQSYEESIACLGAASIISAEMNNLNNHIFFGYGDRFHEFATWVRQLWAESLGKNGKGGLFIPAIGPLDQHSQLQLYYGGPDNKTYSFIISHNEHSEKLIVKAEADSALSYLNNKSIHDVVTASYNGTIQSLRSIGRKVRTFEIEDYNNRTLGALMMHYIIETLFASYILKINPYDQPAVEDSKKRTQSILRK